MPENTTKRAPKTRKRSETPRLGRDDWLDAAFKAATEGGFDKVRVLLLADALKVTRGSFYWHFEDHAALIEALLARWRAREIASHQRLQADPLDDPQADLERLLDATLAHAGTDLHHMRFELALRELGRRDPAVAAMLVDVDAQRLALFEHKFRRLTGEAKSAGELAALFYLAIVGSHQALSRPASAPPSKQYLKDIIASYLIRGQAPPDKPPRRARKA